MQTHFKLSHRIFFALLMVIILTAISVVIITIYNFRSHSYLFAEINLRNKEKQVLASIDYEIDRYHEMATSDNIFTILQNSILGIADIHKTDINVFDTRGNLILTTEANPPENKVIPKKVLDSLSLNQGYLEEPIVGNRDKKVFTTYQYINNFRNEPVAIVNIPYKLDDSLISSNMKSLLNQFAVLLLFILIAGIFISWLIAKYITNKIEVIADKIKKTDVVIHNRPIEYHQNDELKPLVDSYNEMLEKLNQQSNLLALTEREEAWREMAKQVAHEIKNPLTPMRMMIQNYVRKYDPNDPNAYEKLKDLSETMVAQIDTMSAIAEAFSDFARMPTRKDEKVNVVETIQNTLEIFPENTTHFHTNVDELNINFDKIYLIRIITNLVKNAIQAIPSDRKPEVNVHLQKIKDHFVIRVSDNGIGIPPELGDKIFEPKFTTSTGGMGLGLAMVKKIVEDYNGNIRYISEKGRGTEFSIRIPYVKEHF